ncbi:unnamed protein product [Closterium sp. NIES-53]
MDDDHDMGSYYRGSRIYPHVAGPPKMGPTICTFAMTARLAVSGGEGPSSVAALPVFGQSLLAESWDSPDEGESPGWRSGSINVDAKEGPSRLAASTAVNAATTADDTADATADATAAPLSTAFPGLLSGSLGVDLRPGLGSRGPSLDRTAQGSRSAPHVTVAAAAALAIAAVDKEQRQEKAAAAAAAEVSGERSVSTIEAAANLLGRGRRRREVGVSPREAGPSCGGSIASTNRTSRDAGAAAAAGGGVPLGMPPTPKRASRHGRSRSSMAFLSLSPFSFSSQASTSVVSSPLGTQHASDVGSSAASPRLLSSDMAAAGSLAGPAAATSASSASPSPRLLAPPDGLQPSSLFAKSRRAKGSHSRSRSLSEPYWFLGQASGLDLKSPSRFRFGPRAFSVSGGGGEGEGEGGTVGAGASGAGLSDTGGLSSGDDALRGMSGRTGRNPEGSSAAGATGSWRRTRSRGRALSPIRSDSFDRSHGDTCHSAISDRVSFSANALPPLAIPASTSLDDTPQASPLPGGGGGGRSSRLQFLPPIPARTDAGGSGFSPCGSPHSSRGAGSAAGSATNSCANSPRMPFSPLRWAGLGALGFRTSSSLKASMGGGRGGLGSGSGSGGGEDDLLVSDDGGGTAGIGGGVVGEGGGGGRRVRIQPGTRGGGGGGIVGGAGAGRRERAHRRSLSVDFVSPLFAPLMAARNPFSPRPPLFHQAGNPPPRAHVFISPSSSSASPRPVPSSAAADSSPSPSSGRLPAHSAHALPSPSAHALPSPSSHPLPSPSAHPLPSPSAYPPPSPAAHPLPSPFAHSRPPRPASPLQSSPHHRSADSIRLLDFGGTRGSEACGRERDGECEGESSGGDCSSSVLRSPRIPTAGGAGGERGKGGGGEGESAESGWEKGQRKKAGWGGSAFGRSSTFAPFGPSKLVPTSNRHRKSASLSTFPSIVEHSIAEHCVLAQGDAEGLGGGSDLGEGGDGGRGSVGRGEGEGMGGGSIHALMTKGRAQAGSSGAYGDGGKEEKQKQGEGKEEGKEEQKEQGREAGKVKEVG